MIARGTIRHLLVVAAGFPTARSPGTGTFVRELVGAFVRSGCECTVISPRPWHRNPTGPEQLAPYASEAGKPAAAYFPRYLSVGWSPRAGSWRARFAQMQFEAAVRRTTLAKQPRVDCVYGHFLFAAGGAACDIARRLGLPVFAAAGESNFDNVKAIGVERARDRLRGLNGVVAVSEANREEVIRLGLASADRVAVFPNGVDRTKFAERDRSAAREILQLPLDAFIVLFVGHFNHRKGALRACNVVEGAEGLLGVFVGAGPEQPVGRQVLVFGEQAHSKMPLFYNAADALILPTLAEGCANVIVEALACGLPVIASDIPANRELLGGGRGLLLNAEDRKTWVEELLRRRASASVQAALRVEARAAGEHFDVDDRAARILAFMNERLHVPK